MHSLCELTAREADTLLASTAIAICAVVAMPEPAPRVAVKHSHSHNHIHKTRYEPYSSSSRSSGRATPAEKRVVPLQRTERITVTEKTAAAKTVQEVRLL